MTAPINGVKLSTKNTGTTTYLPNTRITIKPAPKVAKRAKNCWLECDQCVLGSSEHSTRYPLYIVVCAVISRNSPKRANQANTKTIDTIEKNTDNK